MSISLANFIIPDFFKQKLCKGAHHPDEDVTPPQSLYFILLYCFHDRKNLPGFECLEFLAKAACHSFSCVPVRWFQ